MAESATVKLTPQQIAEIKASREPTGVLMKRYGVKRTTIWRHRMDESPGESEREVREHARMKQRVRDIRATSELAKREQLRKEISRITWMTA